MLQAIVVAPLLLILEILAASFVEASPWMELEPGLTLGLFSFEDTPQGIQVLRIDPQHYTFELGCASKEGQSNSLSMWAQKKAFLATINASMFLPDGRTSTGYLRQGSLINNPRISKRFGAFFVANPQQSSLPKAQILEADTPNLAQILAQYELVVQNFRLISQDQRVLWSASENRHTIAAVGMDAQGRILFLYCHTPTTPHAFATYLLQLPLELKTTMYVEGGVQAGLYLSSKRLLRAFDAHSLLVQPLALPVPNVLGIKRIAPSIP